MGLAHMREISACGRRVKRRLGTELKAKSSRRHSFRRFQMPKSFIEWLAEPQELYVPSKGSAVMESSKQIRPGVYSIIMQLPDGRRVTSVLDCTLPPGL